MRFDSLEGITVGRIVSNRAGCLVDIVVISDAAKSPINTFAREEEERYRKRGQRLQFLNPIPPWTDVLDCDIRYTTEPTSYTLTCRQVIKARSTKFSSLSRHIGRRDSQIGTSSSKSLDDGADHANGIAHTVISIGDGGSRSGGTCISFCGRGHDQE